MIVATGTWVDIIDWTTYSDNRPAARYRLRLGPDGTLAFWHRNRDIYTLTHHCPDGTVLTVGPMKGATKARRAMEQARRAAA